MRAWIVSGPGPIDAHPLEFDLAHDRVTGAAVLAVGGSG